MHSIQSATQAPVTVCRVSDLQRPNLQTVPQTVRAAIRPGPTPVIVDGWSVNDNQKPKLFKFTGKEKVITSTNPVNPTDYFSYVI